MMNVNVSFLANEYSGFSNLCAFACQQAAQAAALATDRLPKAWQPAIPIMAFKMPLCSAVLFALECPGVRSRENALAQTAEL